MNKKLIKKHAVMMEYVIVAVLIAAAVVVAVIVFGRTAKEEFNVATTAMTDAQKAKELQQQTATTSQKNIKEANTHAKDLQNYSNVKDASDK